MGDVEVEITPPDGPPSTFEASVGEWQHRKAMIALAPRTKGPEHSRLLEPLADHGLAASFDHTRADEEVLLAEFGIAHAVGASLEASASVRISSTTSGLVEDGSKRGYQLCGSSPYRAAAHAGESGSKLSGSLRH